MKIAYVVSLFPKISETFILREMVELRRRGVEIVVVSLRKPRETIRHPESEEFAGSTMVVPSASGALGAFVRALRTRPGATLRLVLRVVGSHAGHPILLAKSLPLIPVAAAVAERLRESGVEHVHAHWATWPAQVAWAVRRLSGIPYSITAHAHDIYLPNPLLAEKIRESSFTATISEHNVELLRRRCGAEAARKVALVRCGVPLEAFPLREGAPAGRPQIVSVGRLVDYKGFPTLLDAVRLLRERGREIDCTIVGEGPMLVPIRERIRREHRTGSVRLLGSRTQSEVRDLLAGASLCALASERGRDGQMDGIPVVLMEALALGVPAVSTRLSGIPELIEDGVTGLLVPPRDAASLAEAVSKLLDDPDLAARLAAAGRRRIEDGYDAARNAGVLLGLIEERTRETS